jgi:hypothetical protein
MRRNKYNATPQVVDGHRFPSKREAKRYADLVLLQRAGQIHDLRIQVAYPLKVGDKIIGKYVADFVYWEGKAEIVEDCKGYRTPIYKWKKKHFEAQYKRNIKET